MKLLQPLSFITFAVALSACEPTTVEIDQSSGESQTSQAQDGNPLSVIKSVEITNSAGNSGTLSDPIPVAFESAFEISWNIESSGTNFIGIEILSSGSNINESWNTAGERTSLISVASCEQSGACNIDFIECETLLGGGLPNLVCEYESQDTGGKKQTIALFDKLPGISSLNDYPSTFQIVASVCSEAELINCDKTLSGYLELFTE